MSNRVRRHYRAAQKQIEKTLPRVRGTFVTKKQKNHIIIVASILFIVIFIKGLLIGYLVGRERS